MIVECPACRARFRLAESLFQGAKGLRLRCRKCGEGIAVLNPAPSPAEPEPPASPPMEDLLSIPFGREPATREERSASPLPSIDNLFISMQPESPPSEATSPLPPAEEATNKARNPSQPLTVIVPARPPLVRPVFLAVAFLALLVAGGAGYFGLTDSGKETFESLLNDVQSKFLGGVDSAPAYDIRKATGYYETNESAGKLFVIKGTVTNTGRTASGGIRIQALLFNDKSQALEEKTVYAGNMIPDEALRLQDRARIEAAMRNRFGDGKTNRDIPPGNSLPFMVVFFASRYNIASYQVIALDAQ